MRHFQQIGTVAAKLVADAGEKRAAAATNSAAGIEGGGMPLHGSSASTPPFTQAGEGRPASELNEMAAPSGDQTQPGVGAIRQRALPAAKRPVLTLIMSAKDRRAAIAPIGRSPRPAARLSLVLCVDNSVAHERTGP